MRRRFDDGYYELQPDGSEVWRPTSGWLIPLARLVEWVSDQPQNYRWRRAERKTKLLKVQELLERRPPAQGRFDRWE